MIMNRYSGFGNNSVDGQFNCHLIKRHGHVSAAKKYVQTHWCIIYATGQVADFSLSKLHMALFSTKSTYCLHIQSLTYVPNLKEIVPAVPEIQVSETRRIFFVFSSSLHQTIKSCTNYVLVHQFQ